MLEENIQGLVKLEDAICNFNLVEVSKYIPFKTKKVIINNVLEACTTIDKITKFKKIDSASKRLAIQFFICNLTTNIDLSQEEAINVYDKLRSSNLISYIYENIDEDDISFIENCVEEQIQEIYKVDNGIEAVIQKEISKLVDKIPDEKGIKKIIKELTKAVNKLDPEKLKFAAQAIGWNNGVNIDKLKKDVK